ncbi:glycosyltransferase [Parendozoicomonas haliclonae]|uniref:Glycosyltransferase sugar-binding region containing DXD motif protein n=2 Tax=Parendozoicomonas haliclonae TaxID=1960125 RepID=A0A1X7ADB8_9GAMM|nr:Glycosyltransferase sugar-binding region containing DXD motif protein [Parendozoicomonas haliclonae]
MRWDESNIPTDNEYVDLVLSAKKWAFLSDYVRLHALYNYGGIYLDTDVQVLKNFEHELEGVDCLFGFETSLSSEYLYVGTAVIGARKGAALIEEFLSRYDKRLGKRMVRDDRVTGPKVLEPLLAKRGLTHANTQTLLGVRLLRKELFYPDTEQEIMDAYTIHDWDGSWRTADKTSLINKIHKKKRKMGEKLYSLFGHNRN